MLVIVYGLIGETGSVCRSYLQENGFERVKKFNYSTAPQLTPSVGTRPYVSRKVFYSNTDPLFRYEVGGIQVGCNREQIERSVGGEIDAFITLATEDISFLESIKSVQEVKRIYEEQVRLVYVYIDEHSLQDMVEKIPNVSAEEKAYRLRLGQQIKRQYLENQDLFDDVLIYGGTESPFGLDELKEQLKTLLRRYRPEEQRPVAYGDVVIPCAPEDRNVYEELREWIQANGVSVFDNDQLEGKVIHQVAMMEDAIRHAKMVVPICSRAFSHAEGIHRALVVRMIREYGKQAVPVEWGAKAGAADLWYSDPCRITKRDYAEDLEYAAGVVVNILQTQEEIRRHYQQVETYLNLEMYADACQVQRKHFDLCIEEGILENIQSSAEKLFSIYLHLMDIQSAMRVLSMAMDYVGCAPSLVYGFARCAYILEWSQQEITDWLTEDNEHWTAERKEQLLTAFTALYPRAEAAVAASAAAGAAATTAIAPSGMASEKDEKEIAEYSEKALQLFENIVVASPNLSRQDLIDGYRRIVDYCQEVKLKGSVPTTCLQRIKELEDRGAAQVEERPTTETSALKVFLGKAFPQSGFYDVFISYKSENEAQARDVYDFLTKQGKVVFFAPKTLNAIGNTDYTAEIMKAIEHSVHMVLVGDNPAYFSTDWVKREWTAFLKKGKGQLVLVLKDGTTKKNVDGLPQVLSKKQILSLSTYKTCLLSFLSKVE